MSDYIADIRRLIGTRPLILAGADVLVVDAQGRLLLQCRSDTGEWAFPGGMMEPGETFEETARRELLEETGLTLGSLEFLALWSGPEFYFRYPNGDEVYNVSATYICREFTGELTLDSESTALGFYPLNALPGPLGRMHLPALDAYRDRMKA